MNFLNLNLLKRSTLRNSKIFSFQKKINALEFPNLFLGQGQPKIPKSFPPERWTHWNSWIFFSWKTNTQKFQNILLPQGLPQIPESFPPGRPALWNSRMFSSQKTLEFQNILILEGQTYRISNLFFLEEQPFIINIFQAEVDLLIFKRDINHTDVSWATGGPWVSEPLPSLPCLAPDWNNKNTPPKHNASFIVV